MPSGRDIHTPIPYTPQVLEADVLARMRAPPEPSESARSAGDNDSSSGESTEERSNVPGAFPGQPAANSTESSYY